MIRAFAARAVAIAWAVRASRAGPWSPTRANVACCMSMTRSAVLIGRPVHEYAGQVHDCQPCCEHVQPTDFIERFGAVKKRIHALAEAAYAEVELGSMQAKLIRH